MKVVFGHGSFGNILRIEISDELLAKAVVILEQLEAMSIIYDAQFSANLLVQGSDDPGDYGVNKVWLAISAGPEIEVENAHDLVIRVLTGETVGDIMIESGGPEGPNAVSYTDVREMPDIYVDNLVAGGADDVERNYPGRDQEWWRCYVRDISTTDGEHAAIMMAGQKYVKEVKKWEQEEKERSSD